MQGLEASSEKWSRLPLGRPDRRLAIYNEGMMLDGRCWFGFHKEKVNLLKLERCLTTEPERSKPSSILGKSNPFGQVPEKTHEGGRGGVS